MTQPVGRSFITYLFATVVTGVASLLLLPIYTRALGPAGYGDLDLGLALSTLLTSLGVIGLDTALGIAWFRDDQGTRPALKTAALLLSFAVSVVAAVAGLVIAIPIVANITTDISLGPTALVVVFVPAATILRVGQTLVRQEFRPNAFLVISVAQAVTTVVVGIVGVAWLGWGAIGAAAAYAAGWTVAAIASLMALRPRRRPAGLEPAARRLLKLGLPVAPAAVAIWLYALVDRFIVAHYAGAVDLGLYAASARLAAVVGLFVAAGQLAWGPLAMSVSRNVHARRFYAGALLLFSIASAAAVVVTAALAPDAVPFFLGQEYAEAARVLWILVGALLVSGAYYVVAIGLNIAEKTGDIARSTWLAAVVNVILNFILIPPLGYQGAAIATLLSYVIAAAAVYAWSQRSYPIPYRLWSIVVVWLSGFTMAAALTSLDGTPRAVVIILGAVLIAAVIARTEAIRELGWSLGFVRSGPAAAVFEGDGPAAT